MTEISANFIVKFIICGLGVYVLANCPIGILLTIIIVILISWFMLYVVQLQLPMLPILTDLSNLDELLQDCDVGAAMDEGNVENQKEKTI